MIGSFHPSPTFHPASRFRLRITHSQTRHERNHRSPSEKELKSNYLYSSTSNEALGLKPQERGCANTNRPSSPERLLAKTMIACTSEQSDSHRQPILAASNRVGGKC